VKKGGEEGAETGIRTSSAGFLAALLFIDGGGFTFVHRKRPQRRKKRAEEGVSTAPVGPGFGFTSVSVSVWASRFG
jgi:hypothetical protein